jgi:tRNA 2-selenouridine synthase
LKAQLDCLVALHGRHTIVRWQMQADRGEWHPLVADLLEHHYDPAYRRSTRMNYLRFDAAEVMRPADLAASSIEQLAMDIHELVQGTEAVK